MDHAGVTHTVLGSAAGGVVLVGCSFGVEGGQGNHDKAGGGPRVPDTVHQRRENTGGNKEEGGSTS